MTSGAIRSNAGGPAAAASRLSASGASATVTKGSKLDLMRMIGADLVHRMESANDTDRMRLFMQFRTVQDQIVGLKHRLPLLASRPSALGWVDSWTPGS